MRKLSARLLGAIVLALVFYPGSLAFANYTGNSAKIIAVSNTANDINDLSDISDSSVKEADNNSQKDIEVKDSQGESSPLLTPEPGMIIWTLIVFVLLLIVLGKWIWPVILKALKDREAKLTNDFQEAESARDEAKKTLAEYKKQLSDAQREAQQIIQKSRDDARKLSEQLKEKTQQDLNQMRERMESDIESAKQQAIGEVHEQTAIVATKIATRILRREIDESDQKNLVDFSIEEFGRLTNSADR